MTCFCVREDRNCKKCKSFVSEVDSMPTKYVDVILRKFWDLVENHRGK